MDSAEYRAGYEAGYLEGRHDGLVVTGAVLAILSLLLTLAISRVYTFLRLKLYPVCLRYVDEGSELILKIQKWRNPVFDVYCSIISLTVGVEFYITFLPFLFWIGEPELARSLTLLMAFCIFCGNAAKDVICSPRPHSPPVHREMKGHGVQEYGMPSTHALNGVCMAFYVLHFYWVRDYFSAVQMATLVSIFIVWIFSVCVGRLYLGMHTLMDVCVGSTMGLVILLYWCLVDNYIEAWITSSGPAVEFFQLCMSIVLLAAYPTPRDKTPSFSYVVYFVGVVFGVVVGSHRTFEIFHSPAALVPILARRNALPLPSLLANFIGLRMLVGMAIVLLHQFSVDFICRRCLPVVLENLRVPYYIEDVKKDAKEKEDTPKKKKSDDDNEKNPDPKFHAVNVTTIRRFLSYAAVGWAVVEPTPYVFRALGL